MTEEWERGPDAYRWRPVEKIEHEPATADDGSG